MTTNLLTTLRKLISSAGRKSDEGSFRNEFKKLFSDFVDDLGKIANENDEMVADVADFAKGREKLKAKKTIETFLRKIQSAYSRGYKRFAELAKKNKPINLATKKAITLEEMKKHTSRVSRFLRVVNVRAEIYLEEVEDYQIKLNKDQTKLLKDLKALTVDELYNAWKHEMWGSELDDE